MRSSNVERGRAAVDDLLDERGQGGAGGPLLGESGDLLLRGDLAGEQEPEETLGQGLRAARCLGKRLLDLRDRLATETDTLLYNVYVRGAVTIG